MIRVRDDDILLGTPEERLVFFDLHKSLCKYTNMFKHVAAIVVDSLMVDYESLNKIRQEIDTGKLEPQLHGLYHVDYNKLEFDNICTHLDKSIYWFKNELDYIPTIWYTPFGAEGEKLERAAKTYHLELRGTKSEISKVRGVNSVIDRLRQQGDNVDINRIVGDSEIFIHWWRDNRRIEAILEVIRFGSWDKAAEYNLDLFKEWI